MCWECNEMCARLHVYESKTILGSWLPGLTAGKCGVTPQWAGLELWKLNPEQDCITLFSTRGSK